jgi:DNA-binding response OmpR family regulator
VSNLSPLGANHAAELPADPRLHAVRRLGAQDAEAWLGRGLALLSNARFAEAEQWADSAPLALLGDLLRADVRMRLLEAQVPALVALREQVDADSADGRPLWGWASAMIAERLAVEGDVEAIRVAVEAMGVLDASTLAPVLPTYTRARLLRVLSFGHLLASTVAAGASQQLFDEAVNLFVRCGFAHELAVTRAMRSSALALLGYEDPAVCVAMLTQARSGFPGDRVLWALILDNLLGVIGLTMEDRSVAEPAFARLEASSGPDRLVMLPEWGRAAFALVEDGPSPAGEARLVEAVGCLQTDPWQQTVGQHHAAHLLFDVESPLAAGLTVTLPVPAANPVDHLERQLLLDRRDIAGGRPPSSDEVLGRLQALEEAGRGRLAAIQALRLALTFTHTGDEIRAGDLRQWAVARMPDPAGRWPYERRLLELEPKPGSAPAPSAGAAQAVAMLEIEVLHAELRVRVGGEPVTLPGSHALLLLTLALAHPAPVHIEAVHEALWPGQRFKRHRINTRIHRLRSGLGTAGSLILRRAQTVAIDATGCETDLERYRTALGGGPAERVRAVAGVRANLCDAAFPYEEHLIEARRLFVADWIDQARRLVAEGGVEHHVFEGARRALAVEPHSLR